MDYLLLGISVLACTANSALFTLQSRRALDTKFRSYLFNAAMFFATFLLFAFTAIGGNFSAYSLLFGLGFGVISATGTMCQIFALSRGPMHITTLIITSSMIIPALSDVFFVGPEAISWPKVVTIVVLIFFLFCAAGKEKNASSIKRGWLPLCMASFFCIAAVGIMQKIHQGSSHREETSLFLAAAFFSATIFALILALCFRRAHLAHQAAQSDTAAPKKKWALLSFFLIAIVCGVCVFLNNDLNLKLSGRMPSQLFFPLVDGCPIVLSSLIALIFFREKLSVRQAIGLVGGTVSLIVLCVLP